MPRTQGRILSLGFPLPGPLVDNYNIISAPSRITSTARSSWR